MHLLLPLLVLGLSVALAAASQAQDRQHQGSGGTSASLQITFGTTPHWSGVRGTHVRMIRQAERPDYDMFRYGSYYYAYNNNHWYRSRQMRGNFSAIDDRSVPREFSKVPRDRWHSYPQGWSDQNDNRRDGRYGQNR
jgi:hypothetical protein